jgi:DNA-binding GntR family transcriptional regulator
MTQMQGELSDLLASVAPNGATRENCIKQHCAVAEAIAAGDAGGARDAMRAHLETTEHLLGQRMNGSAHDVG